MTTVILPRGFWWILDFSKLLISGQVPKSRKNCGEEEDEKKAIPKCCALQENGIKCGHVVYWLDFNFFDIKMFSDIKPQNQLLYRFVCNITYLSFKKMWWKVNARLGTYITQTCNFTKNNDIFWKLCSIFCYEVLEKDFFQNEV